MSVSRLATVISFGRCLRVAPTLVATFQLFSSDFGTDIDIRFSVSTSKVVPYVQQFSTSSSIFVGSPYITFRSAPYVHSLLALLLLS